VIAVAHPSTTTIVIPVKAGREKALDEYLTAVGCNRSSKLFKGLASMGSIHYARFVLLPAENGFGALLAFESNHDGDDDEHLSELACFLATELDRMFDFCDGYPECPDHGKRTRFLRRHAVSGVTPYRGHPNLPVAMIKNDMALKKAIANFVDAETGRGGLAGTPAEIRDAIRLHVDDNHKHLERGSYPRELPSWLSFGLVVVGLLIGISGFSAILLVLALGISGPAIFAAWAGTFIGLVLLVLAGYLAFGRWVRGIERLERAESDKKRGLVIREPDRRMREIFWTEDRQTQNALTHVAIVKKTPGRPLVLWIILTAVRLLAAMLYVRGKLGSIDSIHCARWIPIDGGRRLLFFSNYDGSWESYLGEFVDKLPFWLTAVWSNTEDFPTTTDRFGGNGARDEEWFKRWTRTRQHYTHLWYAAYPNLSVQNVNDNAALREGLTRPLGDKELRAWLRLI
jgi:hypothetical protein